jgi:hypothetical protein
MTGSGNDFGETLRRALSAAGQVEPTDDGLERIRAQVRARTPKPRLAAALSVVFPWPVYRLLQYRTMVGDVLRQWLAAFIALSRRLVLWLSRNTTAAARELHQAGTAAGRPRHAAEHDPPSDHIGWIRPALAAASVAFAATLAMTVPPVRQAIVQLGSSVISTGHTQRAPDGTATGNGERSLMNSPGQGVGVSSPRPSPSSTRASSCAATVNPAPSGGATRAATTMQAAGQGATTCATPSAVATLPPTSPATSASPTTPPTSPPPTTAPPTTPPASSPPGGPTPPSDQATSTP